MQAVNLRSFSRKVKANKSAFKRFLKKVENIPPRKLLSTLQEIDTKVWKEIDCLTCGNCCKKMTPTFTKKDINRIADYLKMSKEAFIEKWLVYEKKDGDWINKKQPCQFLNKKDNKCSIYEVRPADCAGFPHFTKKQPTLYLHVHQQNIAYCPATYKMVENLQLALPNYLPKNKNGYK